MVDLAGIRRVLLEGVLHHLVRVEEQLLAHFAAEVAAAALPPLRRLQLHLLDDGLRRGHLSSRDSLFSLVDDEVVSYLLSVELSVLVLQVALTVGLGGEPIVAQLALVGFLSSMDPHVAGQGALVTTGISTGANIALIWGFFEVFLIVSLESSEIWIDSRTESTGKLSLELHIPDDWIIIPMRPNVFP